MSFLVNEEQCVKKDENWKIETKFTNCSVAILKLTFWGFHFAYFMTLNSAFKYRNLWQFVIICWIVISDNYG